jgi:hypothetical protein
VDGFPALGLLRRLRPTRRPSADDEPARHQPGRLAGRAVAGRFPRSPRDRSTASAPSYSPAASPRVRRSPSSWPPGQPNDSRPWSRLSLTRARRALLTGPDPPGSSRRSCFRGFHHWFLHSYASPSRLPGPSRLAVPTRPVVVGAAPTLPGVSQVRLPPASPGCCDSPTAEPFHLHPVSWRLVAHPLHLPPLPPKPRRGLHPTPGDPRSDAPSAQHPPAARVVVTLVGVQFGRSPARPARATAWPDDCRDGVHHGFQQLGVVGVGR